MLNPNGYCGVMMPEKVMRKLLVMTEKFQLEVQRVLLDNADSLYEANWRLAYPNGRQEAIRFADKNNVIDRIKLFKANKPEYCPEVYLGTGFCKLSEAVIKQIEEDAIANERAE